MSTTDAELTTAGLRLDGTLFPLDTVRAALRAADRHAELARRAALALKVADVQRAARGRLAGEGGPVAARLLAHLDDAEAQAWAQLGAALGLACADDGPRVPRREG